MDFLRAIADSPDLTAKFMDNRECVLCHAVMNGVCCVNEQNNDQFSTCAYSMSR